VPTSGEPVTAPALELVPLLASTAAASDYSAAEDSAALDTVYDAASLPAVPLPLGTPLLPLRTAVAVTVAPITVDFDIGFLDRIDALIAATDPVSDASAAAAGVDVTEVLHDRDDDENVHAIVMEPSTEAARRFFAPAHAAAAATAAAAPVMTVKDGNAEAAAAPAHRVPTRDSIADEIRLFMRRFLPPSSPDAGAPSSISTAGAGGAVDWTGLTRALTALCISTPPLSATGSSGADHDAAAAAAAAAELRSLLHRLSWSSVGADAWQQQTPGLPPAPAAVPAAALSAQWLVSVESISVRVAVPSARVLLPPLSVAAPAVGGSVLERALAPLARAALPLADARRAYALVAAAEGRMADAADPTEAARARDGARAPQPGDGLLLWPALGAERVLGSATAFGAGADSAPSFWLARDPLSVLEHISLSASATATAAATAAPAAAAAPPRLLLGLDARGPQRLDEALMLTVTRLTVTSRTQRADCALWGEDATSGPTATAAVAATATAAAAARIGANLTASSASSDSVGVGAGNRQPAVAAAVDVFNRVLHSAPAVPPAPTLPPAAAAALLASLLPLQTSASRRAAVPPGLARRLDFSARAGQLTHSFELTGAAAPDASSSLGNGGSSGSAAADATSVDWACVSALLFAPLLLSGGVDTGAAAAADQYSRLLTSLRGLVATAASPSAASELAQGRGLRAPDTSASAGAAVVASVDVTTAPPLVSSIVLRFASAKVYLLSSAEIAKDTPVLFAAAWRRRAAGAGSGDDLLSSIPEPTLVRKCICSVSAVPTTAALEAALRADGNPAATAAGVGVTAAAAAAAAGGPLGVRAVAVDDNTALPSVVITLPPRPTALSAAAAAAGWDGGPRELWAALVTVTAAVAAAAAVAPLTAATAAAAAATAAAVAAAGAVVGAVPNSSISSAATRPGPNMCAGAGRAPQRRSSVSSSHASLHRGNDAGASATAAVAAAAAGAADMAHASVVSVATVPLISVASARVGASLPVVLLPATTSPDDAATEQQLPLAHDGPARARSSEAELRRVTDIVTFAEGLEAAATEAARGSTAAGLRALAVAEGALPATMAASAAWLLLLGAVARARARATAAADAATAAAGALDSGDAPALAARARAAAGTSELTVTITLPSCLVDLSQRELALVTEIGEAISEGNGYLHSNPGAVAAAAAAEARAVGGDVDAAVTAALARPVFGVFAPEPTPAGSAATAPAVSAPTPAGTLLHAFTDLVRLRRAAAARADRAASAARVLDAVYNAGVPAAATRGGEVLKPAFFSAVATPALVVALHRLCTAPPPELFTGDAHAARGDFDLLQLLVESSAAETAEARRLHAQLMAPRGPAATAAVAAAAAAVEPAPTPAAAAPAKPQPLVSAPAAASTTPAEEDPDAALEALHRAFSGSGAVGVDAPPAEAPPVHAAAAAQAPAAATMAAAAPQMSLSDFVCGLPFPPAIAAFLLAASAGPEAHSTLLRRGPLRYQRAYARTPLSALEPVALAPALTPLAVVAALGDAAAARKLATAGAHPGPALALLGSVLAHAARAATVPETPAPQVLSQQAAAVWLKRWLAAPPTATTPEGVSTAQALPGGRAVVAELLLWVSIPTDPRALAAVAVNAAGAGAEPGAVTQAGVIDLTDVEPEPVLSPGNETGNDSGAFGSLRASAAALGVSASDLFHSVLESPDSASDGYGDGAAVLFKPSASGQRGYFLGESVRDLGATSQLGGTLFESIGADGAAEPETLADLTVAATPVQPRWLALDFLRVYLTDNTSVCLSERVLAITAAVAHAKSADADDDGPDSDIERLASDDARFADALKALVSQDRHTKALFDAFSSRDAAGAGAMIKDVAADTRTPLPLVVELARALRGSIDALDGSIIALSAATEPALGPVFVPYLDGQDQSELVWGCVDLTAPVCSAGGDWALADAAVGAVLTAPRLASATTVVSSSVEHGLADALRHEAIRPSRLSVKSILVALGHAIKMIKSVESDEKQLENSGVIDLFRLGEIFRFLNKHVRPLLGHKFPGLFKKFTGK
jgi:hypothetical protein